MNAPLYAAHAAGHVLLLADRDGDLRTEQNTLKALGTSNVLTLSKRDEVLEYLKGLTDKSFSEKNPDAIICDENFDGQSIFFFLKDLAEDFSLARIPVLMVCSSSRGQENSRICRIESICRPYTQDEFTKALVRVMSPLRKPLPYVVLKDFCRQLKVKNKEKYSSKTRAGVVVRTTTDYLQSGRKKLLAKDIKGAEWDFKTVISRNPDNVDAYLNMARIRRLNGDGQSTRDYLVKAAAASLRTRQYSLSESIKDLLSEEVKKSGIYYNEALAYLREGFYRDAAVSFFEHCKDNRDIPLHAAIGTACQRTDNPNYYLEKLCRAYASMGFEETAEKLSKRLFFSSGSYSSQKRRSWLEKHPRVKEIFDIASHTAALWRQAL